MRLETYEFKEFLLWLQSISRPHTAFEFKAGAKWKDGILSFFLDWEGFPE